MAGRFDAKGDMTLAGVAVTAPALAVLGLSTPMLIVRPPTYLELEVARRARLPLLGAGAAAAAGLALRAVRGKVPGRLLLRTAAGFAGVTGTAAAGYDPWLFSQRRRPLRVRPASAARQVLGADTEIVGVRLNGQARAYPARLLARPHLLTDTLGGEPVAVSYCGLTNSAIAYRIPGGDGHCELSVLSAPRNNILYWDKRSRSFVQQLLPRLAYGSAAGQPLDTMPVVYTTWDVWSQLAPETTIADAPWESPRDRLISGLMRREHVRTRARPATLLATGKVDTRLPRKTQLLGLVENDCAAAYTRTLLHAKQVVNDTVGQQPVAVFHEPTSGIAMAYRRRLHDRTLTFQPVDRTGQSGPTGPLATDDATGSTWNVLGHCLAGPLTGHQLEPVPFSFDKAFWFAWAAYHPTTGLHAHPDETHRGLPPRMTTDRRVHGAAADESAGSSKAAGYQIGVRDTDSH